MRHHRNAPTYISAIAIALVASGCHVNRPYEPTPPAESASALETLKSLPSLEDTQTQLQSAIDQIASTASAHRLARVVTVTGTFNPSRLGGSVVPREPVVGRSCAAWLSDRTRGTGTCASRGAPLAFPSSRPCSACRSYQKRPGHVDSVGETRRGEFYRRDSGVSSRVGPPPAQEVLGSPEAKSLRAVELDPAPPCPSNASAPPPRDPSPRE